MELHPARQLGHGRAPPDRRHRAAVEERERLGALALQQPADLLGHVLARLHGHGRELRQRPAVLGGDGGDVADGPHARMALDHQVAADHDPPLAPRGQPEGLGERVGAHAGGPDHRVGRQHLARGEADVVGRHLVDRLVEAQLDAPGGQRGGGVALRARGERGQQRVTGLDQHDPGPGDVEVGVVAAEHDREQLGERPGRLDPGGAAADDHEGERAALDERRGRRPRPRTARPRGCAGRPRRRACRAGRRARPLR